METKSNQKVEHFLSQFVFSCLGLGVFFRRALIPASPGFVGIPGAFCRKSRRGGGWGGGVFIAVGGLDFGPAASLSLFLCLYSVFSFFVIVSLAVRLLYHRVLGRPFTLSSCPWPSCLCIVLLFFFLFRACGIRCRSGWPTRRYSERYRGFQAATEKCQHVGSGLVSHRDVYDVRSIRSSEHLCDPAGQTLIRYDGWGSSLPGGACP